MALQPNSFNGQDRLQPGARGEQFESNTPGYRDQGDNRVNRTNNKLATNAHDVPNIKYEFDRRLPVLFRYGFAFGYNQIVVPKGRLVAGDPNMSLLDFDMKHANNALTLANGGAPVRLRTAGDIYDNTSMVDGAKRGQAALNMAKDWCPLVGLAEAYSPLSYKPFAGGVGPNAQLKTKGYAIDASTGRVVPKAYAIGEFDGTNPLAPIAAGAADTIRVGNVPIGVISRNEYTRDDDAYNGMMPGAIMTDAMIDLPWFSFKDKAEGNPWGSAYGGLFPGALVKSDENGRFVVSPLSFPETEMVGMSILEYELERQQVVGQVYSVDTSLIPEGAAKWATWALSDRMNFVDFNPAVYKQNGREGEDAVTNSPYASDGGYPGYPYDKSVTENDLHMLASTARSASNRMDPSYQYENLGIPGLTDGHNAVVRDIPLEVVGKINKAATDVEYVDMFFKSSEVSVESLEISIKGGALVNCVQGALLANDSLSIKYADAKQGIIVISVVDRAAFETFLGAATSASVQLKYNKRGLAGVPTFLDWDGCVGSVKVLLTK